VTVQRYVTGALSGAGARPAERVPDGEFSGNTRRPADGVSAGGKLLRVGPTDNVQTRIEKNTSRTASDVCCLYDIITVIRQ